MRNEEKLVDFTLPEKETRIGALHILEQTLNEIKNIFTSIGFHIAYGPEVDDEYHNFSALNIPAPDKSTSVAPDSTLIT